MPNSVRFIPVPNCGAQTQASIMDPRPRAYHPAPICSFRSFASAYPEVKTGCAPPFPSTDPILGADAGGPRTRPPEVGGSPRGRAAREHGKQREERRARRSNSRRLLLTGKPHPLRHQRRPANGRAGKAGLTSEGPRGGATRGGRDVEGGLHLTDRSS